jgi:hypothetical protein
MVKDILSCDAYFETIQHKKKVPKCLQLSLTAAFRGLEVAQYPGVPRGKVTHIRGKIIESKRGKINKFIFIFFPPHLTQLLRYQGIC